VPFSYLFGGGARLSFVAFAAAFAHSLLGTLDSWTQSERGSFFTGLEETVLFRTV
jgi:hypothetical protein